MEQRVDDDDDYRELREPIQVRAEDIMFGGKLVAAAFGLAITLTVGGVWAWAAINHKVDGEAADISSMQAQMPKLRDHLRSIDQSLAAIDNKLGIQPSQHASALP